MVSKYSSELDNIEMVIVLKGFVWIMVYKIKEF